MRSLKLGKYFGIIALFIGLGATSVTANQLFKENNQDSPLKTMQSMMDAVHYCGSGEKDRCRDLAQLCHSDGDNDVWSICYMGTYTKEKQKEYSEFWGSVSLGAELINGNRAMVHFMFEWEDTWHKEYMKLGLENGKWYLSSF